MSRYIDRDKFIGNIKTDHWGVTNMVEVGIALDKSVADVVEVVRCRDCKHYRLDDEGWCDIHSEVDLSPDDFCSYGERREE